MSEVDAEQRDPRRAGQLRAAQQGAVSTEDDLEVRRSRWMNVVARLKPGVSAQQATAAMDPLWKALRAEEFKELASRGEDFRRGFVDKSTLTLLEGSKGFSGFREYAGKSLKILMGMVCLLALMAAANVAGLLLVRAAGRHHTF